MHTLGQWLATRLGLSPSLVGLVVLPALGLLLIFSLREVVLAVAFRVGHATKTRRLWRQVSLYVAILSGLVVVGGTWQLYLPDIVDGLSSLGPQSDEILGAILAVGVNAAILAVVLYGVQRAYGALSDRVEEWGETRAGIRVQDTVFLSSEALQHGAELALRILRVVVVLFILYLFLPLVLESVPATRSVAHQVMPLVFEPLKSLASAIVGYIPSFVTLVLIFIIARWTIRAFRVFMRAVGDGEITLGRFDPAWAEQTYGLVRALMILATILVMYPYLPGASSNIFKGFSVFVGALVTFGASPTTNNVFNGLILTYTGAYQEGDWVRIGDRVGTVLELGMVATRLRTLDNEKVTIANSEVVKGQIVNYTAAQTMGGLKLRVTAGIGYDTEWRDVHRLLTEAARATDNVAADPAPRVLHSSLGDFAVTYTLVATADDPSRTPETLSELRQNIQDVFNEAGVEIMTPSVRAVREAPVSALPERYVTADASSDSKDTTRGDSNQ
ncbi:MAG: mechanosensitive ion channel [marine benthic group bacterium]|nr:mechanosensitive ion channel [Gemmatimonadota bacterium]